MDDLVTLVKEELKDETEICDNSTDWQLNGHCDQLLTGKEEMFPEMETKTRIKEEMDQKWMKMVKKEPVDEKPMVEQLLKTKEKLLLDDKESLTIFASAQPDSSSIAIKCETNECAEDCDDCIKAHQSEQLAGAVSSLVSPSLDDDSDRMPSDWFCGESSDSEETIIDEPVTDTDEGTVDGSVTASASNFPIKAEPLLDDEESLSPTTQPASPSIVVKGETCLCSGDCPDCQSKRSPPCPECGKTFSSNPHLKRHLKVHSGERPFVCGQCPKAFKELRALKQHQPIHQTVRRRPFGCTAEGCGKAFTTKQKLARHLRVHTGDRPFVCAQCQKAFSRLCTLTQHQATHQAVRERPFLCSAEGCGKAFTRNTELTAHIRTHSGDKPHKCNSCDKRFTKSSSLTVHIRTHTGEKPYKCDTCGKAFTVSSNLKDHLRSHTGERPHQCPLCPKVFAQSSSAKKHQQTAHPESP